MKLVLTYLWIGASSSLTTASTELENLRSSYKDLETKLAEAERKRERAEKQLAEKNSELTKKEGEFEMKRKVDSDTLQKQQKEIKGLRRYMETAKKHWDLVNADVMGMNPELIK
jgi:flagellar biosynthesis chaperone FliJ